MKRDWDLLRKQLIDIEEDRDVLADLPQEPKWTHESDAEFREYLVVESKLLGHLELLINGGYIEGITLMRDADGRLYYGVHNPRLTMAGHDLLDAMRSKPVWEKIKSTAQSKGIELTFDTIKALAGWALKQVIGTS